MRENGLVEETGERWRFWPADVVLWTGDSIRAATHLSAWEQNFAEHRGDVFFWGSGHPKKLKAAGDWPPRRRRDEKAIRLKKVAFSRSPANLSLEQEVCIDRGLAAFQRKQQRLTDPGDRAALGSLIRNAGSEGLVLHAGPGGIWKLTGDTEPEELW